MCVCVCVNGERRRECYGGRQSAGQAATVNNYSNAKDPTPEINFLVFLNFFFCCCYLFFTI